MGTSILTRLDARDRALFSRWTIGPSSAPSARHLWTLLTHLGGPWGSVTLAALPLLFDGSPRLAAWIALKSLGLSHIMVQLMKRTIGRTRPFRVLDGTSLVTPPDRFSFPSGHATSAMSVAIVYAALFPAFALPLLLLASLVGLSRVRLGVHYPSDVFVGQAIAVTVGAMVLAIFR